MADYKQLYETSAVNTGGRDGVSYLTDGTLEVTIRSPKEMGGQGGGTNPEQLFALGYSACFNGALEGVLGQEGIKDKSLAELKVKFFKANGPDFKLGVEIELAIENQPLEKVQELAEKTHEICPYSKATRGNIEVDIKAVEYDASKEK